MSVLITALSRSLPDTNLLVTVFFYISILAVYGADYYLRMRTSEAGSFEHLLGEEGTEGMPLLPLGQCFS